MAETAVKDSKDRRKCYERVTIYVKMKQQRSATDDNVKKGHGSTNDTKHGSNNDGKKLRTYRPLHATVHTYFKAGANGTMETETNIHGVLLQVNKTVTCHVSHLLLAKLKADF